MACWRCVICFVFVALTLKALLSHINTAHGRSQNFHVICGVNGCVEEYHVFNSFYYHLRRTHPQYCATGIPPREWLTVSLEKNEIGREHFGTAIFADSSPETRETTGIAEAEELVSASNTTMDEEPVSTQGSPSVMLEMMEPEGTQRLLKLDPGLGETQTPWLNQVIYFYFVNI